MNRILTTCTIALLIQAGCAKNDDEKAHQSKSAAGASSEQLLDAYITKRTGTSAASVPAERREQLKQELSRLEAAASRATTSPQLQASIGLARVELLAHAAAEQAGVYRNPSEEELHAAYDALKSALPANEFQVAHILVPTEGIATGLILQLKAGKAFADVARTSSVDQSKKNGGDLGWIVAGKLPAEFMKAVHELKPGEFTNSPIKTIYGWHVIKVLDQRTSTAPPFEAVRAQLASNLQQARYATFLDESAKVAAAER